MAVPPTDICRLCAGQAVFAGRQKLLGKYETDYFRCVTCDSLQTEKPYWLAEAYSDAAPPLDPGAVQRCLNNVALTLVVSRILRCCRMLDYGGGAGLLCRLLRDAGRDAYWFDRYAFPAYAAGFAAASTESF